MPPIYAGDQLIGKVYSGDKLLSSIKIGNETVGFWTPENLGPSLALWLDADDADSVTLNGSSVSQWNDKSGNNRHAAQNTATQQPLYLANGLNGKPIVRGDNTDDVLIGNFDVAAANDISVVFVAPGINLQDCIFDFFSPSTGARAVNINDIIARQSSSGLVTSNDPVAVSLTVPFLAVATHTNSDATAQFDLKLNGGSASFAGYPAGLSSSPLFTTELFERYALLDDSTGGNLGGGGWRIHCRRKSYCDQPPKTGRLPSPQMGLNRKLAE